MAAVAQFLAVRDIPAPSSDWQGIRKLRGGEKILLRKGERVQPAQYYHLRFGERGRKSDLVVEDAPAELWRRIVASVRLRLRSDVPVGLFLSGGIDSKIGRASCRERV